MARKSKQQRIIEADDLIALIRQDSVLAQEQSWLLGFLEQMKAKFSRGKGGTTRQRALFDEKITAGVPSRKVNNHVAQPMVKEADAALGILRNNLSLYEWELRVGSELVSKGLKYNLSDAQLGLLEKIVATAQAYKEQMEAPKVDDDRIAEAELLINLADCYTQLPARKMKLVNIVRSAIYNGVAFTDRQFEDLRDAVKGQKKKYDKWARRAQEGDLVKAYIRNGVSGETHHAIVMGPIEFKTRKTFSAWSGHRNQKYMFVPVLVGDTFMECSPENITRFTKKELKAAGL